MLDSRTKQRRLGTDLDQDNHKSNNKINIMGKHTESCPKLTSSRVLNPQKACFGTNGSIRRERRSTQKSTQGFMDPLNHNQMMKTILKSSYDQQIKREQQRKQQERKMNIMQERDYLSQFQRQPSLQLLSQKKIKQGYKKELLDQIHQKKVMIDHIKTQQTALSRIYQQPRTHHHNHKSQAFLQFYDEALKYQKKVEKEYQGYMKNQEKYVKSRNRQSVFDIKKNLQLMQQHSQQTHKMQQQKQMSLRKALHDQIHKNSQQKQPRQLSRKQKRYTQIHDPIGNPINYGFDPNNKYILSQILKTAPREGNKDK